MAKSEKIKISERVIHLINLLNKAPAPLSAEELSNISDKKYNIKKQVVYVAACDGWLESEVIEGRKKVYKLSNAALNVLKFPEKFEPTPYTMKPKDYDGKPIANSKKNSQIENIEPLQKELNLSVSTNVLMDNISTVIQENANYRELMLDVLETIAKSLGLIVMTKEQLQIQILKNKQ